MLDRGAAMVTKQQVAILYQIVLSCSLLSIVGYTFMLATLLGIKALRTQSNSIIINLALSGLVNHIVYCFLAPVDPAMCATPQRYGTQPPGYSVI
jgi:hypothetical protein